MPTYRIGPLHLSSNRPLPEVRRASSDACDWSFRVLDHRRGATADINWFHQWVFPDGRAWLLLGRNGRDYRLRFGRLADFDVCRADRRIACYPGRRTAPTTVRHLLLDQVLPLVFSTGPSLVLHASAVRTPAGAIGFTGPAGSGKSTLAVSLARGGWDLLSDDCLLVEADRTGARALPSYPSARLWGDSIRALYGGTPRRLTGVAPYTRKRRVAAGPGQFPFCDDPVPLVRLYVLNPQPRPGAAARLTRLSGRQAMIELLRFTFHLDVTDRAALARRFALAGRVAGRVTASRLTLPSDLRALGSVRRLLQTDLKLG